jgi:3-deoxy-D-manno-octulosonic-acid transferase
VSETTSERLARWLYSLGWYCGTPLALGYIGWRSLRQPAYLERIGERLGLQAVRGDNAPLIWVHAVSVGETRAAQPLIRGLLERYPAHRILLTHMTPTGLATGRELFADAMIPREGGPPRIEQSMLPWDYPSAIRRFLRAWRPVVGIVIETELWPNLVAVARQQRVPVALVNARLSARSLRKGLRWARLTRPALRSLALVLAQTDADAHRIAQLGRSQVTVTGNLKFDVAPPPRAELLGHVWRLGLSASEDPANRRPVLLAASTREGEEAQLLDAWLRIHREAGRAGKPPLLVIVPRHPQRFDEVEREIVRRGLTITRRSTWGDRKPPVQDRDVDVVLGDSMGELFSYYALADVAIIGGSLLPYGGQNLIEACAAGVPVIIGPHTFNFETAAAQAIDEDAALRVADAGEALRQSLDLLGDPVRLRTIGERGLAFAARHRGATRRTLDALAPLISEPTTDRPAAH